MFYRISIILSLFSIARGELLTDYAFVLQDGSQNGGIAWIEGQMLFGTNDVFEGDLRINGDISFSSFGCPDFGNGSLYYTGEVVDWGACNEDIFFSDSGIPNPPIAIDSIEINDSLLFNDILDNVTYTFRGDSKIDLEGSAKDTLIMTEINFIPAGFYVTQWWYLIPPISGDEDVEFNAAHYYHNHSMDTGETCGMYDSHHFDFEYWNVPGIQGNDCDIFTCDSLIYESEYVTLEKTFFPNSGPTVIHVKGGQVLVRGVLSGQYTLVTDDSIQYRVPLTDQIDYLFGNIWLIDDIVYEDSYGNGAVIHPDDGGTQNSLGLVSGANIIVANTKPNGAKGRMYGADIKINAALISPKGSFLSHYWQNTLTWCYDWDSNLPWGYVGDGRGGHRNPYRSEEESGVYTLTDDIRGTISYWGTMIQNRQGHLKRNAPGPYNASPGVGYDLNWNYDWNFQNSPPAFLDMDLSASRHVSVTGSDSNGDGTEDAPFATIQKAIDASSWWDSIFVGEGVYYEMLDLNEKHLSITGSGHETTIIDASQSGPGPVVTIMNLDSTTYLGGFTISGGADSDSGGGLLVVNSYSRFEDLRITQNSSGKGGGLFIDSVMWDDQHPRLKNVIIDNNTSNHGGGLYIKDSYLSADHITVSDNSVDVEHAGAIWMNNSSLRLTNSILWGNGSGIAISNSGPMDSLIIFFSDLQGGQASIVAVDNGELRLGLENNIDNDPLFMGDTDYHLQWLSPAIDAGDPAFELDTDGTVTDMGALQFNQHLVAPVAPTGFSYTNSEGQYVLSWDSNDEIDMDHYVIYHGNTPNAIDQVVELVNPPATTYDLEINLSQLEHYYYMTAVDTASLESSPSDTITITLSEALLTDVSVAPATPLVFDEITVTTLINEGDTGIETSTLYFNIGGTSDYESLEMSGSNGLYTGTIPGEKVTATGLYYYVVVDIPTGVSLMSDTLGISVRFQAGNLSIASVEGSAYSSGLPMDKWRILSIPADLDNRSVNYVIGAKLGPIDSMIWRMFRYDRSAQIYEDDISDLVLGESYWLYQRVEDNLIIDAPAGQTGSMDGTSLIMGPGWNFISSPYQFPINLVLDQAIFYGPISYGKFNEGWDDIVTVLEPWGGYALYNRMDSDQTILIDPNALNENGRTAMHLGESGCVIELRAWSDEYSDHYNYFGNKEGALNSMDMHDVPEIKAPGNSISLYFINDQIEGQRLRSDFRDLSQDLQLWSVSLESNGIEQSVTLSWEFLNDIGQGLSAQLIDLQGRSLVDMSTEDEIVLGELNDMYPRHIRIGIGEPSVVTNALMEIMSNVPERMFLNRNYPNPFNPTTTIVFGIPEPRKIKLSILNILGQEISVLANGWHDMGKYEVNWYGIGKHGRPVPSGLYFSILNDGSLQIVSKMLMIK